MSKRFNELGRVITRAIVQDDCLVLYQMTSPGNRAFNFPTSSRKIGEFMKWLQTQIDNGILQVTNINQVGEALDAAWTNIYIYNSYKRGIMRARQELKHAGFNVPMFGDELEWDNYLTQPFHTDRLGILYVRTFNDLKGITDAMSSQISRVLTQGMADGDNPRLIARKLNAVIKRGGQDLGITDTIGRYIPARRRAEILARTEIIRAHHSATIQEYRNWGAEGVQLLAEFRTAGDDRVCEICQSFHGNTYTLDKAEGVIPVHPQCRCMMLPFRKGKDKSERWNDLAAVRGGQLQSI
jgi:SPP1 gp7 family putative phage head morphogenesis protein